MEASRAGTARAHAGPQIRWAQDDAWLAIATPVLIFLGHLIYGAMLPQTALSLTAAAALLLGACLLRPRLWRDLQRLDGLSLPAALFGLVIVVALWSLTPFVPGGPHPVWRYLGISPAAATIDRSATLLETSKLLGLGCIFTLGAITGASDARARLAVNTVLALIAAFGAWSLLSFLAHLQPGGERMSTSLLSANAAGTLFAMGATLALGPLVSRLTGHRREGLSGVTLLSLGALICLMCLFATASRGAFFALLAALLTFGLLMVFSGRLPWTRAAVVAGTGAVATLALLLFGGELLLNRLLANGGDFASRAFILKIHWLAFLDSPLFGYGLGTFDTINRVLLNAASFPGLWKVRAAHSVYLDWLEQGGLFAALPMFACVAAIILTSMRKAFRRSRLVTTLFAFFALDMVFLVHGASDFALELFSVAAMWAYLLGVQFSASQGSSR